jgi:hypothetical protein
MGSCGNYNGVYDSYQPLGNYGLSNIFFHWDIAESDTYACVIEGVSPRNKSGIVLMKEYRLNDVKLNKVNEGNQSCKFWFTNDGMNIIPMWFKRILIEYVMFYWTRVMNIVYERKLSRRLFFPILSLVM